MPIETRIESTINAALDLLLSYQTQGEGDTILHQHRPVSRDPITPADIEDARSFIEVMLQGEEVRPTREVKIFGPAEPCRELPTKLERIREAIFVQAVVRNNEVRTDAEALYRDAHQAAKNAIVWETANRLGVPLPGKKPRVLQQSDDDPRYIVEDFIGNDNLEYYAVYAKRGRVIYWHETRQRAENVCRFLEYLRTGKNRCGIPQFGTDREAIEAIAGIDGLEIE